MIGTTWNLTRRIGLALIFGVTIFGVIPASHADDSSNTRAARLTYLQGSVTVYTPENSAGIDAQLNLPLLSGVQVVTGQDGQAEVEFEDGSVVRLTPNSAISLDNLAIDPNGVFSTNLSLQHGLAYAELRATPQYRYAIMAGADLLSPVENTTVRINFDEPPATFAVLDGTVHIERLLAPGSDLSSAAYQTDVRAGESLRADPVDSSRYFLTQGVDQDTWDQWNEDLDQSAAAQSADTTDVRNNYAGAQGYGWSDLDANGTWYDVPGQGPVWQPTVAVDDSSFDPYGNGAWIDYSGVGYVWASAYPWGWTPYRCGNWSYFSSFGWGWAPGAGCGGLGWGFAGGGRPVNIAVAPINYRSIRVPSPGHGPERPLIAVHSPGMAPSGVPRQPGERIPRQIAGVTARPIMPLHNNMPPPGEPAGSSLRRDFPMDSANHTPVMGLAGTRPTMLQSAGRRQTNMPQPASSEPLPPMAPPAAPVPSYNRRPANSAPVARPEPGASQTQRYTPPSSTPAQPQPPPERRTYAPAPSSPAQSTPTPRPTYSQPAPRPSYAPPASPPAQQHSSPPPAQSSAPSRDRQH
jgi:hypothetical protein